MANLKLGTKFTFLLLIILVGGIIVSGVALWRILQGRAQAEITSKGLILIETMSSVRSYTGDHIRPLLEDNLEYSEFVAEIVPAFSARQVFDRFRQEKEYAKFFYKEAALNPRRLLDEADSFEIELVEQMRQESDLTELSGYRDRMGERVYYIARPLAVTSESCLVCHSSPEIAPEKLVERYGAEHGFGWQLGEIIAAQVVYVPAQEIFATAIRSFMAIMVLAVAVLAAMIFLVNFLLKRYVIQPIDVMGNLAQKIGADELVPQDLESTSLLRITARSDELGQLAQVVQRMARDVYAHLQSLKQQVNKLRIEIDQAKRQAQVAQVVDSDFFQDLKSRAGEMRQQRSREQDVLSGEDQATDLENGNQEDGDPAGE